MQFQITATFLLVVWLVLEGLAYPGDTALSGSFKVGQVGTPEPGLLPRNTSTNIK